MGVPSPAKVRRMRKGIHAFMEELSPVIPMVDQLIILNKATGKNRIGLMNEEDCKKAFGALRSLFKRNQKRLTEMRDPGDMGGLFAGMRSEMMRLCQKASTMDSRGDPSSADEIDMMLFSL